MPQLGAASPPRMGPRSLLAKLAWRCTNPGLSSAMTLGLLPFPPCVRIRSVFILPCPAKDHRMALFSHDIRLSTHALWPSPWLNWRHPGFRRLHPPLRPYLCLTGRLFFLHVCPGPNLNTEWRMALVRAVQLARHRHHAVTLSAIFGLHGPVVS